MTLIEFFDKNHLENVYSCLAVEPERVIILGPVNKSEAAVAGYKKVFEGRGKNIEFITEYLPSRLTDAASVICEIVDKYEDCVFDITGGSEVALTALGIVYERLRRQGKNVQIHRYNANNNKLSNCDGDSKSDIDGGEIFLTGEENVRIYGGDVIYEDRDGEACTYRWEMTDSFEADVDRMWRIAQKNQREWNRQINVFEIICECGTIAGLETSVSKHVFLNYIRI